jgi:hypothetical protein
LLGDSELRDGNDDLILRDFDEADVAPTLTDAEPLGGLGNEDRVLLGDQTGFLLLDLLRYHLLDLLSRGSAQRQ